MPLEQPNIPPERSPPIRSRQAVLRRIPIPEPPRPSAQATQDGPVALIRAVTGMIRRGWVPLMIWTVACMILAALYARSLPPVYTATSSIILQSVGQAGAAGQDPISPVTLDLNRVDSELQVIRSERLQGRVFETLGLATIPELQPTPPGPVRYVIDLLGGIFAASPAEETVPAEETTDTAAGTETEAASFPAPTAAQQAEEVAFAAFRDRFSARRIGQSYVIEISYSSSDPELAARVANSAASAYLLQSVAFKAGVASSGGEFVQMRLDSLSAQVEDAANAVRDGTLPQAAMPDADARVIGAALRPLSPSEPRPKLIVATGAVLGLLSGLFAMALSGALDRRVHEGDKLERETAMPRLAFIPEEKRLTGRQGDVVVTIRPDSACAHGLRDLRTAIDLAGGLDPQPGGRIIALAEWTPGSGCSMIAMNLARLIRAGGQEVTVIDADLDGRARGLTDWYVPNPGRTTDEEVDADGVRLVPSTALRAQSGAISDMRDRGLTRLLGHLQARGDVVLDLPPLAESADALALARHADLVVIVAETHTTFDELTQAAERLGRLGVAVVGVAVNHPPGLAERRGLFARLGLGDARPGSMRHTTRAAISSVRDASARKRGKAV
ncbi:Wzz/FepE/Etk N-terminal domain-containing protein [Paenirhodobacter populi]|uniref:Wzz/FepE/Etk N-terminal domain-containing protein n=1 Tax=Paenirhodobacter populi TaxID=2306993 RepID=UPI000FE31FAD|nr:Wzz/FepE/Etk N-terminal domain-containing protein [Sinirhodobacter populi]RWR08339.1 exopolysaccharide biosynthesis protein [Sinirhodobacter populi]